MGNGRVVEMLLMLNIHILSNAGRRFPCSRQRLMQSVKVVLDKTLQPINGTCFKVTVLLKVTPAMNT